MKKTILAIVATLALIGPAAANEIKIGKAGWWEVSCWKQSHCSFSSAFTARNRAAARQLRVRKGSYVNIVFGINDPNLQTFAMVFGSPDWKISDRQYNVKFKFSDGGFNWQCDGIPKAQSIACRVSGTPSLEAWTSVAADNSFQLVVEGHDMGLFGLKDSKKALQMALNAYQRHIEGNDSGGTFGPSRGNVDPNETF